MLQVTSECDLGTLESIVRGAAHRKGASVAAITHMGQLLHEAEAAGDAIVFSICQPQLYAALLGAEVRMAAFLPCRIAAYARGKKTYLETLSPLEFCRLLGREDLAPFAHPLEALLSGILDEAAQPAAAVRAIAGADRAGLGATEEQMSVRGAIPQRIDCRGTKVEELAGTGEHDAKGG